MTKTIQRLLVAFTACLMIAAWCSTAAFAETQFSKTARGDALITFHQLKADIFPAEHSITATDTISLGGQGKRTLRFTLNRNLKLESLTAGKRELKYTSADTDDLEEHLAAYSVEIPGGVGEITLSYSGEIYDPIEEETTLAHVVGGRTSGIISEEGLYLDGGSGWYPTEKGMLAGFDFSFRAPHGFTLVTQGDLIRREGGAGSAFSYWRSDIPQDGFVLVGNKFTAKSRRVGEVTLTTYFFENDAHLADRFLDATEDYLRFYTDLLGEFPYNRFDIVENFFQTGYGMPGYTLLGDAVIRMVERGGYDVTGPSGIAHELMHNWWGNFVFFDADKGNWCEAITTYLTNYYWLETHSAGEALQWRKHASVKFSVNAQPGKAYPLRDFRGKENEVDGAVGYEKGAMFFHFIRRAIGDEAFFAGLRQVIAERGARFATWDDFKKAFKEQAPNELSRNVSLDEVFDQWLTRTDAPSFWIESAKNEQDAATGEWKLAADFRQTQPCWILKLAFSLKCKDGGVLAEGLLQMNDRASSFLVTGPKPYPTCTVRLDPEWHIFRRVPPVAQEPCLNMVLNEPGAVVVYPTGTDEISTELIKLAGVIQAGGRNLNIVPDTEFNRQMLQEHSVFILGGSATNRAWELAGDLIPPETFTTNQKSFSFKRRVMMAPEDSILVTFANGERPGRFISVYHGNSPAALARSRYIFFYGWDSYLFFSGGRMTGRGMLPAATNPWQAELVAAPAMNRGDDHET